MRQTQSAGGRTESGPRTPQGLGISLGEFGDGNPLEEIIAISDKLPKSVFAGLANPISE
jgi:hypothetical protein